MTPKIINNEKFFSDAKVAFNNLFDSARQKNELHYAFALSPEFGPYRYNPSIECDIAFEQYLSFLSNTDYPELRPRIALAFYCHLAEASGYWWIVKNMLCIANGEFYKPIPFDEFKRLHKDSGKLIAPNANQVMKSIAGLANALGNTLLSEAFRDAYDPDLRNGFSHADYVLLDKGISLGNRDGTQRIVLWEEADLLLKRGIGFYKCLKETRDQQFEQYSKEKEIVGRLSKEPPGKWYIHFDKPQYQFRIGNSSFTSTSQIEAL